jgi:hypothetical protein
MAKLRFLEEGEASQEVQELYRQIKAGFGAGQVPNVYKVLANNPQVLAAAVDNRRRIMDEGQHEQEAGGRDRRG